MLDRLLPAQEMALPANASSDLTESRSVMDSSLRHLDSIELELQRAQGGAPGKRSARGSRGGLSVWRCGRPHAVVRRVHGRRPPVGARVHEVQWPGSDRWARAHE